MYSIDFNNVTILNTNYLNCNCNEIQFLIISILNTQPRYMYSGTPQHCVWSIHVPYMA